MIALMLVWALYAFEGEIGQVVARYETAAECDIGRMQWEMQHVVRTACAEVER